MTGLAIEASAQSLRECARCGVQHEVGSIHACTPYAHRVKRVAAERDQLRQRVKVLEAKLSADRVDKLEETIRVLTKERDDLLERSATQMDALEDMVHQLARASDTITAHAFEGAALRRRIDDAMRALGPRTE
jgi:uncharacterized coiled-coil DUF342 family protein